jgi:hypothetical protein
MGFHRFGGEKPSPLVVGFKLLVKDLVQMRGSLLREPLNSETTVAATTLGTLIEAKGHGYMRVF